MSSKELVLMAFTAIFSDFDPQAAKELLAPDYIQHNPAVPTGAAAILGFIPALEQSGVKVTTHRVITEGDLVVLHNTYENAQLFGAETQVAFDIFRVENGKVAEHWDNLQPIVRETVSGRTMTNGATQIADLDKTAANKALVQSFVVDVLHGKAPENLTRYVSADTYFQHNPAIGDGLDGLGAAFAAMAEAGLSMAYTETPIVVAEGNFVFAASQGVFMDKPTAFFDLFRVQDGQIVEHWDVISEIPSEMAHDNGKF